jgi:hypothetical protein
MKNETYRGRSEITRWRKETAAKYNYTSQPIAIEENEGKSVVTAHLVGDFPGSPIDLQ